MSFSSQVKGELFKSFPEKACCMLSELSALTQTCASLRLSGKGRVRVVYETENSDLAKRIFLLLKRRMEIVPSLEFNRHKRLGGRRLSILSVSEAESRRLLIALRMLEESEGGPVFRGVPRTAMTRRCCRGAYVRAAFLGSGAITDPEREYHLEFTSTGSRTETLTKILEKSGIPPLVTTRREAKVVYLRKGDDVVNCLALMGAHRSLMQMENTRIARDARNQANRGTNCDTANLKRQLSAGEKQARAIVNYSLAHSLGGLPKELQEIGRLRMLHPEASLTDLGQMLAVPLGKSGVNHRLRRLMALVETNQSSNGDEPHDQGNHESIGHHAPESGTDRASGAGGQPVFGAGDVRDQ